jgi:DNA-binding transcriptional LysR family regulator
MEFNQVRYFLAVAEHLNFTNAANDCAVSQPALSKAIQKLEATLGAELFVRNTSDVELTEFGQMMRVHFERIEESRRIAKHAAKSAISSGAENLDIGIMCTINPNRFTNFLKGFTEQHPDIGFVLHDVTAPMIPELLLAGELQCVICARAQVLDHRFTGSTLYSEDMGISFPKGHDFENASEVTLYDIAKEKYIDRLHCEFRSEFLELTKASGLELDVIVNSEREDWIKALIADGIGVSILPQSSSYSDCFRNVKEFKVKSGNIKPISSEVH